MSRLFCNLTTSSYPFKRLNIKLLQNLKVWATRVLIQRYRDSQIAHRDSEKSTRWNLKESRRCQQQISPTIFFIAHSSYPSLLSGESLPQGSKPLQMSLRTRRHTTSCAYVVRGEIRSYQVHHSGRHSRSRFPARPCARSKR